MAVVNVRVDDKVKKEAEEVLADIGLSMSGAIQMYLKQIVIHNGIPFELKASDKGEQN